MISEELLIDQERRIDEEYLVIIAIGPDKEILFT